MTRDEATAKVLEVLKVSYTDWEGDRQLARDIVDALKIEETRRLAAAVKKVLDMSFPDLAESGRLIHVPDHEMYNLEIALYDWEKK